MDEKLNEFQKKLGYTFKKPALLREALTHSSYANENKRRGAGGSNERLEFLGDSVLGMTVAKMIYLSRGDMPEGRMTRLRAELVCEKTLAAVAVSLSIGEYLLLGRGESKTGGYQRPSILADAVEAVLAAIYLDGGFEPVSRIVTNLLGYRMDLLEFENTDYKTSLQEVIQEKAGQTLAYCVTDESGPDHLKMFTVEVRLNGQVLGRGEGGSKKEAEQSAARAALAEMSR